MPDIIDLIDVDSHLGALPDAPVPYAEASGLVTSQRRLGITGCVLTAVSALLHDPAVGNSETAAVVSEVPGASTGVMITPPMPDVATVLDHPCWSGAALATAAPDLHGWALNDPALDRVYRSLADLGRPLRLGGHHTGWAAIEQFAGRWPQIPLLVTEVGYRALRRLAGILERNPSVHVVISDFATHEGIEWLVEHFGSHRVLFGTGAPWRDPGSAAAQLRWSALDDDDLAAVGRDNAVRLMPCLAVAPAAPRPGVTK